MRLPTLVPFITACIVGMMVRETSSENTARTLTDLAGGRRWLPEEMVVGSDNHHRLLPCWNAVSIPTIFITVNFHAFLDIPGTLSSTAVKNTFGVSIPLIV
jgi:hypothetical protein